MVTTGEFFIAGSEISALRKADRFLVKKGMDYIEKIYSTPMFLFREPLQTLERM